MADLFPDFSLGIFEEFKQNILYDLDNREENEILLLAATDIDAVVNKSTTETITSNVPDKVADENTGSISGTNKQRFVNLSSTSIDDIITRAETKNTKGNTKWAVRVFEGKLY